MRENGKTGSRPSRLVGNFPHFHAPAFTQGSHRNLEPVDSPFPLALNGENPCRLTFFLLNLVLPLL